MKELIADRMTSPIGDVVLVADDNTLVYVDFVENEARRQRLLARRYGEFQLIYQTNPHGFSTRLAQYFAGDFAAIAALPISLGGTAFQQRVWLALRDIPVGQTLSYGALAANIGAPTGARAVGMINALNPIGIVLPCHRVIGADKSLTGYAGGLERKRWLLRHEGAIFKDERSHAEFVV